MYKGLYKYLLHLSLICERDISELLEYGMKSFDPNRTGNGEGKPLCICTYFFVSIIGYILITKIKRNTKSFLY